jgi:hypothetical protein
MLEEDILGELNLKAKYRWEHVLQRMFTWQIPTGEYDSRTILEEIW